MAPQTALPCVIAMNGTTWICTDEDLLEAPGEDGSGKELRLKKLSPLTVDRFADYILSYELQRKLDLTIGFDRWLAERNAMKFGNSQ